MKRRELHKLGIPEGEAMGLAQAALRRAAARGDSSNQMRKTLRRVADSADEYVSDDIFGPLARWLLSARTAMGEDELRSDLDYRTWGEDIDPAAHQQMANACRLPISVAAALMPDAHVGYGLPIGGVLATENAVIPYAVGVDIACRVMMTVFDMPPDRLADDPRRFEQVLARNTLFGIGKHYRKPKQHDVMDEDWDVTAVTCRLKRLAAGQLGTSGSGNHFVEFGEIELFEETHGAEPGRYLAVVSHSGSRGSGAQICQHYSQIARSLHPNLPKELRYLAWLDMDAEGAEYWAAMQLMGKYASANHHVIHRDLIADVSEHVLLQIENHHNFAWKETHFGKEVIVHRKGATPAGTDAIGYIPGTMTHPGYLVRGLGQTSSLDSASHGAGRCMSRTKAKQMFGWSHLEDRLREAGVSLMAAGLDEIPDAYKNIDEVMAAQADLVRPIARFQPRIVKMAPGGERPED